MRALSTVSAVFILASALWSTGCLRKDVTHTIYISPSSATWSAMESNVRSDESRLPERVAEEHDYVLSARAGSHPVADALGRLGAQPVTTTWLRNERPYTVMTQGRFADLRQLAIALLRDAKVDGDASLVRSGCRVTFALRANVDSATVDEDSALANLTAETGAYRFVLTEGRFTSADGFTIEDEGAVAVPDPEKEPDAGVLVLSLTWIEESCRLRH